MTPHLLLQLYVARSGPVPMGVHETYTFLFRSSPRYHRHARRRMCLVVKAHNILLLEHNVLVGVDHQVYPL